MTTLTKPIRLDPAPSKVFSWLEFDPSAEEVVDLNSRTIRPATSLLTVRYRTTGLEQEFWPVDESTAQKVFNPGQAYDFSIGKAFNDLIRGAHKSSRTIKSGDRQETKKQRDQIEQRSGRRWLV